MFVGRWGLNEVAVDMEFAVVVIKFDLEPVSGSSIGKVECVFVGWYLCGNGQ